MTIKYSLKKLVYYILSISLFSLLNFGKYMECYLYQWSKRLSQLIFFLVVISLMVVMAIQISYLHLSWIQSQLVAQLNLKI